MSPEERLQRIEHVTAGLADQAKRDHEENRQLWRDTQLQLDDLAKRTAELSSRTLELTTAMIGLTRHMGELTIAQRDASDTIARLAHEARDRDAATDACFEKLTSAIGALLERPRN